MALPVILNINTLSNSWTASLDGKTMLTGAYATAFAQAGSGNAIGVGYASYFNGPVAEVILYNRKLSATERLQVNSYMAIQYGITIDQTVASDYLASDGTTTMWKASDNSGFSNNIAGIGRDEIGSLYQKQSRSINTAASGNLIAIAVGNELAVSNADNTDTITNNKSFLVWGDNNGAVTYTTNITGNNVTVRMPRIWKVDKTNWADRDIIVKLYGSARNTYLLISNNDPTFTTIYQELELGADSTITINSSLLPDGAYFTFGKEILGPGYVNSGVQMWLRADDNVSNVDAWYDFSGNGTDASQATVTSQPLLSTSVMNFNPGLKFDASNDYMQIPQSALTGKFPTGNAARTIIGVAIPLSNATDQALFTYGAFVSNQSSGFRRSVTQEAVFEGNSNPVNVIGPAGSFPINGTTIIGGRYTGGATGVASVYANDTSAGNTGVRNWNTVLSVDGAHIGKYAGESRWWNGYIGELILYNRNISSVEFHRISSYLALKYGVTLDQSPATDYVATNWDGSAGTKMWTAADNGIYNKNIAGIGRDDKTALYQKQSRSASDTLITVAAGGVVAADNLSNGATIDDLSFLYGLMMVELQHFLLPLPAWPMLQAEWRVYGKWIKPTGQMGILPLK